MHVDLASFQGPTEAEDQQVAVVAVPDTNEQVDVYVVGMGCTNGDAQVRAHVRVPQN
jgi:hypothetical protein